MFSGGKGGYTKGTIFLSSGEQLYLFVGSTPTSATGGYNGGASNRPSEFTAQRGAAGGGATDVRIVNGTRDTATSLTSRIMVAGGGGGAGSRGTNGQTVPGGYGDGNGGYGGGLRGGTGEAINNANGYGYYPGGGGTQTAGGVVEVHNGAHTMDESYLTGAQGSFGKGGSNLGISAVGGGGGRYGGAGLYH